MVQVPLFIISVIQDASVCASCFTELPAAVVYKAVCISAPVFPCQKPALFVKGVFHPLPCCVMVSVWFLLNQSDSFQKRCIKITNAPAVRHDAPVSKMQIQHAVPFVINRNLIIVMPAFPQRTTAVLLHGIISNMEGQRRDAVYNQILFLIDKVPCVQIHRVEAKHRTAYFPKHRCKSNDRIARHQLFPVNLLHVTLP